MESEVYLNKILMDGKQIEVEKWMRWERRQRMK